MTELVAPTLEARHFDTHVHVTIALIKRGPDAWDAVEDLLCYAVEQETGAPRGSIRYDDLTVTVKRNRDLGLYRLSTKGVLPIRRCPSTSPESGTACWLSDSFTRHGAGHQSAKDGECVSWPTNDLDYARWRSNGEAVSIHDRPA